MTILKRLIAQKQGGVDVTAAQTALNRVSEIIYGAGIQSCPLFVFSSGNLV